MNKKTIYLDSFSGAVADLKKGQRTADSVITVLKNDPMVSTWDMSENSWLCSIINNLKKEGKIKAEKSDYPWHKYSVV